MKYYNKPVIIIVEADAELLTASGPGATDIGAPTVESVWDEESDNTLFNIREESYEDKVYE